MSPQTQIAGDTAVSRLDEDRLAWLALVLTPGLGPKRILDAVETLQQPGQLFALSLTELEGLQFTAAASQFIFEGHARHVAEREWAAIASEGADILTFSCDAYPERLKEIYDPPPVLWVRGNASVVSRPSIAIVGTRRPSPYGAGVAEMLARDLAARGLLIISGMARGIDSAAHRGALAALMPTLAVWGTGVDVIYPKENKSLAEEILGAGGAMVSELPMGTFPAPQNFPRRNRIISGMSLGVLVVEAGENSGTRVTARCALEQDRDLFAVPGNVTSRNSWTPNTLIKQGAKLVATWEDVWEELPPEVQTQLHAKPAVASNADPAASLLPDPVLRPDEALVLDLLRADEALQLDEILQRLETQLTSAEVFTALMELQLAGRARLLPGKHYIRVL